MTKGREDGADSADSLSSTDSAYILYEEGSSVTASELRYIYRNRERLERKVHFYAKLREVQAPWVQNPKLWAQYKPKSETPFSTLHR